MSDFMQQIAAKGHITPEDLRRLAKDEAPDGMRVDADGRLWMYFDVPGRPSDG